MARFIGPFDTAHDYALHFNITHTHTYTSVHSHVFTSRRLAAASNSGSSASSGFPNYPGALATNS
jgi:hypothetical protein